MQQSNLTETEQKECHATMIGLLSATGEAQVDGLTNSNFIRALENYTSSHFQQLQQQQSLTRAQHDNYTDLISQLSTRRKDLEYAQSTDFKVVIEKLSTFREFFDYVLHPDTHKDTLRAKDINLQGQSLH